MTSSSAAPTGADRARFAGEWQQAPGSAGGELVHLRARDYDPTVGVFLSRDPLATVTLDPYSYAAGNPLVMVDPSGLCNVGPVRIGIMENSNGGCRGGGFAEDAGAFVRSGPVQTVKDTANTLSTWSGAATVVLLGATVVTPPLAPVTVPLAGFTEGVSTWTGGFATAVECVDGGPWGACGMGVVATAAPGLSNKSLGWVAKQYGVNAERAAEAMSNLLGVVLGNTGNTGNTH